MIFIHSQQKILEKASSSSRTTTAPIQGWVPPMMNYFKINVGASFVSTDHCIGIGFLLRNNTGSFRGAKCLQHRSYSSEEAEGLALFEALKWSQEPNISGVILETDAQAIVHYIQGKEVNIDWRCKSILEDCKLLISNSTSIVINYVPRTANRAADCLAKAARLSAYPFSVLCEAPSFMFDILNMDSNFDVSEALPPIVI
ncbi:hypothetical protein BVC80_813g9 [Macleaya cordata]|uniref:RNase H type-1 domain-containing protein n=1 Tax=Macleaya cordata TaxID=56857 RepID=A0A200PM06_MACCD|nr:hypothetical protein BVC80_813g9 [Macleaya cordata]